MQTQDSVVSACDKIKFFEALSKGGCAADRKFSSKAYTPTPYNCFKTPVSVVKRTTETFVDRVANTVSNYVDVTPDLVPNTHHVNEIDADTVGKYETENSEKTETDTAAKHMTDPEVGKSAQILVNDCMMECNTFSWSAATATPSEADITIDTGQLNVLGNTADVEPNDTCSCLELNKIPVDCEDRNKIEDSSDKTKTSKKEDIINLSTELLQCKKKAVFRSKLPLKASNIEIKDTLNKKAKDSKETQKRKTSVEEIQDTGDSWEIKKKRITKRHMENKQRFEPEIEKQEKEMELQLRKMNDILESIRAETEEIEKVIENFTNMITARIEIKYEVDKNISSDIALDEAYLETLVNKNEQDIHDWLGKISEIQKKRIISVKDLQEDIQEMKQFADILKHENKKDASKIINYIREGITYKGSSFDNNRDRLQIAKKSEKSDLKTAMQPVQNQKPDHISIGDDFGHEKRKGGGDCNTQVDGCASAFLERNIKITGSSRENNKQKAENYVDDKKGINASLDLALSSSLKPGDVYPKSKSPKKLDRHQKTPAVVRQMSLEEIVSRERKTKIPKPTWQTYHTASRHRKWPEDSFDISESGDHKKIILAKNQAEQKGVEENECRDLMESSRVKGRENDLRKLSLTLRQGNVGKGLTITDDCTVQITKNLKENPLRLKTKEIKAKIDTGLKSRSKGQTKGKLEKSLRSVQKYEMTKTKPEKSSSRISICSNCRK